MIQSVHAPLLTFGIYPGGVAGTPSGLTTGPPDDPARINRALDQLQAQGHPLLVRGYKHYSRSLTDSAYADNPAEVGQYLMHGRKLDLVLCFRDSGDDLTGWLEFIRDNIRQHGSRLAKLQITEEPNLYDAPGAADGGSPTFGRRWYKASSRQKMKPVNRASARKWDSMRFPHSIRAMISGRASRRWGSNLSLMPWIMSGWIVTRTSSARSLRRVSPATCVTQLLSC